MTRPASLMALMIWTLRSAAGEPVQVVPDDVVREPRQPQAAVGADGTIYVAFGAGKRVYCAASRDGGKTFERSAQVGSVGALALGHRRGPRIAVADAAVVISAIAGEKGGGRDGDVVAWRSTDSGRTWSGPARVNDAHASAREGLHAMAGGRNGQVFCAWLDLRNQRSEIYGAMSKDGGATWGDNVLIYRSPSGSVCECCHPSAAFDREGTVYVMWRNSLHGDRDMYYCTSRDGLAFEPAKKLGAGSWTLDACPMDGGGLAVVAPGKIETIWRREKQVYRADARTNEQLLGGGEQPWATGSANGAFFVWLSRRNGALSLLGPDQRRPSKLADHANDPVIAAPLTGNGPVVAVWESGHKPATILAAVVHP